MAQHPRGWVFLGVAARDPDSIGLKELDFFFHRHVFVFTLRIRNNGRCLLIIYQ